jgi:hypothetical protein
MSIVSPIRITYLLVIRDASVCVAPSGPMEIGALLHEWLVWHDLLESQGKLRFRSAVEPGSQTISRRLGVKWPDDEQRAPICGYLLVEAENLDEVTEIARACPGLARGFTVEIYRSFNGAGGCHPAL